MVSEPEVLPAASVDPMVSLSWHAPTGNMRINFQNAYGTILAHVAAGCSAQTPKRAQIQIQVFGRKSELGDKLSDGLLDPHDGQPY